MRRRVHRYLLAYDGSEDAKLAAERVGEIAGPQDLICIVHVMRNDLLAEANDDADAQFKKKAKAMTLLSDAQQRVLQSSLHGDELRPNLVTELVHGDVRVALLEKSRAFDTICVGGRGDGLITFNIGSVSSFLVYHCTKSVLIVRNLPE